MTDRIELVYACGRLISPNQAQSQSIEKHINQALQTMILALPLPAARGLPGPLRDELSLAVEFTVADTDLPKLAKLWEPNRKLDADNKPTLRRDLLDLLNGARSPYTKPLAAALQLVRALPDADRKSLRVAIERVAPLADIKPLLAKWDPHLKPPPKSRSEVANRLLGLIGGTVQPATPPPPPVKPVRRSAAAAR